MRKCLCLVARPLPFPSISAKRAFSLHFSLQSLGPVPLATVCCSLLSPALCCVRWACTAAVPPFGLVLSRWRWWSSRRRSEGQEEEKRPFCSNPSLFVAFPSANRKKAVSNSASSRRSLSASSTRVCLSLSFTETNMHRLLFCRLCWSASWTTPQRCGR